MSLPENNYYLTITNTDNSEFNPIVKIPKAYTLYIKCNIPYVKIIVEQQNSQEFCELYTVTKLIQREVNDVKEQKIIFKLRPLVAGRMSVNVLIKVVRLRNHELFSDDVLNQFSKSHTIEFQTKLSSFSVINENEIKYFETIGKGGEGIVRKAHFRNDIVAIKQISPIHGDKEIENLDALKTNILTGILDVLEKKLLIIFV